ncbi:MAG: transcriptional repressor LexA [Chthonomonas sp.]|nr:transcriptional repressor LexA [Chthonomonas sp.]
MAKHLTSRQEGILQYILGYVQRHGYPPSIREIGAEFDIGSLRGVTVHLDALEKKGYITRAKTPRSIRVVHPAYQAESRVTMLPLVGTIAAGTPILADEQIDDLIPVPSDMVRNMQGAFMLRIKGDSMRDEGIMPRDLVVIKPQSTANQGDIVAFLLNNDATVKRFSKDKNGIRLLPSNPAYEPIVVQPDDDARVIGKVVGLIRDYEGMAF